jgi:hypothetical protein
MARYARRFDLAERVIMAPTGARLPILEVHLPMIVQTVSHYRVLEKPAWGVRGVVFWLEAQ